MRFVYYTNLWKLEQRFFVGSESSEIIFHSHCNYRNNFLQVLTKILELPDDEIARLAIKQDTDAVNLNAIPKSETGLEQASNFELSFDSSTTSSVDAQPPYSPSVLNSSAYSTNSSIYEPQQISYPTEIWNGCQTQLTVATAPWQHANSSLQQPYAASTPYAGQFERFDDKFSSFWRSRRWNSENYMSNFILTNLDFFRVATFLSV